MIDKKLTSEWGQLSPHLLASMWECDAKGSRISDAIVIAPLSDSNFEVTSNWTSPFEGASANTMPTLQQLLQSGTLIDYAKRTDSVLGTDLEKLAAGFQGKSSVTKLSSTQVWMGSQGGKFNITMELRAWSDPKVEVHDPFNQLMKWCLPVALAADGSILSRLMDQGVKTTTAFPSKTPTFVAVKYKDCTYLPMVIESINKATNSPVDANGRFVSLSVQMSLTNLTAIDRRDWDSFSDAPFRIYS